jgi:hypothetical protein
MDRELVYVLGVEKLQERFSRFCEHSDISCRYYLVHQENILSSLFGTKIVHNCTTKCVLPYAAACIYHGFVQKKIWLKPAYMLTCTTAMYVFMVLTHTDIYIYIYIYINARSFRDMYVHLLQSLTSKYMSVYASATFRACTCWELHYNAWNRNSSFSLVRVYLPLRILYIRLMTNTHACIHTQNISLMT